MKNKLLLAFMALVFAAVMVACQGTTTTEPPVTTQPTTQAPTTQPPVTTTAAPATLDIVGGFAGGWEGVYKTAVAAGVLTVQFDKHGFAWPELVYDVEDDLSDFNKLVVTASGDGVLLVRFASATENHDVRFELSSVEVSRQIDLRDVENLDEVTEIILIAEPGLTVGRGTFVVSEMVFEEGTAFGTVVELGMPEYDGTYDEWIQGGENAYTIATQLDGTVKVDYTKLVDQSYLWMKSTFDAAEAAGFNTMTVTLKGTAGKEVLVKPNDSGAMERKMTFTDTNPMSMTFYASNFANLVLFAQPGDATASTGTFYVVSVILSYTEPTTARWEFNDFLDGTWTFDDAIYDFTFAEDVLTVDWDRVGNEWNVTKYVFPEFLGNHNAIQLTVQGTAGVQIIVKPNDNGAFEKTITFDGTEQTFLFKMGVAPLSCLIFIDPFNGSATGSFDILSAKTLYVPMGTEATTEFAENDLGTYTPSEGDDGWTTIDYMKAAGQEWAFMRNTFDAEEVGDNNTVLIVLRGTVGKQVLVKPNNAGPLEQWVTFTDENPVFVWTVADVLTDMLLFAEGGTAPATGTFEILGVYFSYTQPDALERDEVVDFTFGWVDNGGDMYSFATVEGKNVVTYNKVDGPWNNIKYTFVDNLANHNTLTFVVKGTAGKTITIKPNDVQAYERTITFDGTEQTVVFTLPVAPTHVIIFAELAVGTAAGSFEIISAEATWEPVPLDLNEGYVEGETGTYEFVYNEDGSVTVNYTKTAAQEWTYMIVNYDPELVAGYNTITIVIQGTDGKQAYLKPNDSSAIEQNITFDGTEQTFEWTLEAGFSKFVILAEGGVADADGTFTIISVTLTYEEPAA